MFKAAPGNAMSPTIVEAGSRKTMIHREPQTGRGLYQSRPCFTASLASSSDMPRRLGGALRGGDLALRHDPATGKMEGRLGGVIKGNDVSPVCTGQEIKGRIGGAVGGINFDLRAKDPGRSLAGVWRLPWRCWRVTGTARRASNPRGGGR